MIGGWATCPWQIQASARASPPSSWLCHCARARARHHDHRLLAHPQDSTARPDVYQNEGIYRYTAGTNWRSLTTLLIVVPINLPGLINAIDKNVPIGNLAYFCGIITYRARSAPR